MTADATPESHLEIGHVLFIDIVGYSKLLMNEQSLTIRELNDVVRASSEAQNADAAGQLVRLPTGDGMALVFRNKPEAPAECALQIAVALKDHPRVRVRMGIHSGPVSEVSDVNERVNVAGAGINMAQRVMDCGDAGHILVSQRVADDLAQYERWAPRLHPLGDCTVKHGVVMSVFNLYTDEAGNPARPEKFPARRANRPRAERTIGWLIPAAALLLLLAVAAAGFWLHGRRQPSSPAASPQGASPVGVPQKSIAVLPFANLSDDKGNGYFADGIQDEILTRLAKIGDLKVISRTSTERYKSAPENLREIARQLGVANILEGSVQKSGDQVHINVQLIETEQDSHLWAEVYDRGTRDLFTVESEVAGKIADALHLRLSGGEKTAISAVPTQSAAAYDAYLRGLAYERQVQTFHTNEEIERCFTDAVRIDPTCALAWAHLGTEQSFAYFNQWKRTPEQLANAKHAAETAVTLQPEAPEVYLARGYFHYYGEGDYAAAALDFERARARMPNNPEVLNALAYLARRQGKWDEALQLMRRAAEFDPRNPLALFEWASTAAKMRKFDEARAIVDQALAVAPDDADLAALKALTYQQQGDLPSAGNILRRLKPAEPDANASIYLKVQDLYERRYASVLAAIATDLVNPGGLDGSVRGLVFFYLGLAQARAGNDVAARQAWSDGRLFLEKLRETAPDDAFVADYLALNCAALGDEAAALREAARANESAGHDAMIQPLTAACTGQVQALLGHSDAAIAALPALLTTPGTSLTPAVLRLDPLWDPIRGDPRFRHLAGEP